MTTIPFHFFQTIKNGFLALKDLDNNADVIAAVSNFAGMGNVRSLRQTDGLTSFSDRMVA